MSRRVVQDISQPLRYNGSSSLVNATYAPELNIDEPQSFQIEFKWDGSSNTETLWANSLSASNRNGLVLNGAASPKSIRWGHYNGSSYVRTKSTTINATPGQWYRVIGTSDGTTLRLRVNEVDVSGTDTPALAGTTEKFHIGAGTDSTKYFKGSIAYSRFWSRQLTDSEVLRLGNGESDGSLRDGLIREYGFGEQSLTSLTDTSNAAVNGTITNATPTFDVPSKPRTVTPGFVGSLLHDGSNDVSTISYNSTLNIQDEITVCQDIVFLADLPTAGSSLRASGDEYGFLGSGSSAFDFRVRSSATQYNTSSFTFTKGVRYRIVGTAKVNEPVRLYINGVLVSEGSTLPGQIDEFSSGQTISIGYEGASTRYVNALIKSTRIYNKKMTSAQVRDWTFANKTDLDNATNMVVNLEVKPGSISGTTWVDTSGNGNNATISGATLVSY